MEKQNNNLWIISIVAIVAIVGLFAMFTPQKYVASENSQQYTYTEADLAGQATAIKPTPTKRNTIPDIDEGDSEVVATEDTKHTKYLIQFAQTLTSEYVMATFQGINYKVEGEYNNWAPSKMTCSFIGRDIYVRAENFLYPTDIKLPIENVKSTLLNSNFACETPYLNIDCTSNIDGEVSTILDLSKTDVPKFTNVQVIMKESTGQYYLWIDGTSPNYVIDTFKVSYSEMANGSYVTGDHLSYNVSSNEILNGQYLLPEMTGDLETSFQVFLISDNYDDAAKEELSLVGQYSFRYFPPESKTLETITIDAEDYILLDIVEIKP